MSKMESVTIKNIEAAFAGESMAHIKYRYFAKLARAAGDEDTARIFEQTADQEVMHAFGHLDGLPWRGQGVTQGINQGGGGGWARHGFRLGFAN